MMLHLVCDHSGSMSEGGKPFSMRTLALATAQRISLGYATADIKLYGWATKLHHFHDWNVHDEFPEELLICSGSSNVQALVQCFGNDLDSKVLVLTDGFFPIQDTRVLNRWREALPADTVRFVKIGADAAPEFKGSDVFESEELFSALDGWLGG